VVTSPRGFPFETIVFDVGQMDALYNSLSAAKKDVVNMQFVLRNVSENLEGSGLALDKARSLSSEVAVILEHPSARIERIASIVLRYGTDAETYGGRANLLMTDVTEAQAALETAQADLAVAEAELTAWTGSVECAAWQSGEPTDASPTALLTRHERCNDAAAIAQNALDQATEDLAAAWTAWEAQFEAWDDAYARAVASLAGVDDGFSGSSDAGPVDSPADAPLTALADADTPDEVAAIWDSLTDAERERLSVEYPEFVGNLEGIPYEHRIAANVAVLEVASQTSWGEPTDGEIDVLLKELRRGGVPLSLDLFNKGQATAAILYVDGFNYDPRTIVDPLSGVTNVNVLLGGMLTELRHLEDWGDTATNLNKGISQDGGRGATIVWFGYDTPNYATVGAMDQAVTGAEVLTGFLRGLDHETPSDAVTSVIGHSYGSTTAFLAVGSADDNLGVDNLIAVGSAGLTDQALGTDPDARVDYSQTNVYASTSPEDFWARKGRWAPPATNWLTWGTHPIDPGSLDDAVSFDSDGGYGPNLDGSQPTEAHHDGTRLLQTPGHGTHDESDYLIGTTGYPGGYLQEGSESFANIVEVINTGEPLTVTDGYGSDDWWLW
jgi:hypothetical protein